MKVLLSMSFLSVFLGMSQASAESFTCYSDEAGVRVQVYQHRNQFEANRMGPIIVLSQPDGSLMQRTLVRFFPSTRQSVHQGTNYRAVVDPRTLETGFARRRIGRIELTQLDQIELTVDFSAARSLSGGEEVPGMLALVEESGEKTEFSLECYQHLQDE